ncbi:MAG: hypothetical protein BAJALOKI1v1_670007 [Promethearchaeota archaeon]|nr:MAG: hypothetical protein BAJALOKI1v1_670007 [Candidatus Lokiarchaeota archaeon]
MKLQDSIDYKSILDLEITVDEYRDKLDDLLKQNRIGIAERRKILRQKTQEFKDKKLRINADLRKR